MKKKKFAIIGGILSMLIGGIYFNSSNIDTLTATDAKKEIVRELRKDNSESVIKYKEGKFLKDGKEVDVGNILIRVKAEVLSKIEKRQLQLDLADAKRDFKRRYRLLKMNDMSRFRELAALAGEDSNISNPDAYIRDLIRGIKSYANIEQVNTYFSKLETKLTEYNNAQAMVANSQRDKRLAKRDARIFLKVFDCKSLSNSFLKNLCIYNKQ